MAEFKIAVVGEVNRGKSTLINALLGEEVLPRFQDIQFGLYQTPAMLTMLSEITYDIDKFIEVIYKDGRNEKINFDRLKEGVAKLPEESNERATTIKKIIVHYPIPCCRNGVTIIDTPGINDNDTINEVTMSVLPQIDAAIMVIMAQIPFSEFERWFLLSKIIASDIGKVMFVVTGIDHIDEEDVDRVLRYITDRIQESVAAEARRTYGEGSAGFEKCIRKIGKVYGLSAKKALKAKLNNDDKMLKESRFPEFEAELERILP